jgi:phosphopantetheinyl transferase (holo-ACP synthase)
LRLGNDIVDIAFTAEHNPRFVDRIISPLEKSLFPPLTLNDPLLWKLWAAKEAAYKAIKQKLDIPFHHREFLVNSTLSSVSYHEQTLQLSVMQNGDFVFAVVSDLSAEQIHSRFATFAQEPTADQQSQKARAMLLELAAESLQLPEAELSLQSDARIPRICYQGQRLNVPVSLTHHGRGVAASVGDRR